MTEEHSHSENWDWSTKSEKKFIDVLGSCLKPTVIQGLRNVSPLERRLKLLYRYRYAVLTHRKDWGAMDKKEILEYVTAKIKEIENGGSTKTKAS